MSLSRVALTDSAKTMNSENTTISEEDLTRLLPTCQRCRRLRRKCDTQLPACRLCQKGKAECTFFDHALQQTLPRSYVHSLLTRLNRLRSVQAAVNGSNERLTSFQFPQHDRNISTVSSHVDPSVNDWGTYTSELSFDKHFIIRNANETCWLYLGASSAYALAVEVLVHAQAKLGPVTHPENYAGPEFWLNAQAHDKVELPKSRPTPLRSEVEMLQALYMATTNILMMFIDALETSHNIDIYLKYHGSNVTCLTGVDAHKFFCISMICAVGAANKARHHPSYTAESTAYYVEALQCVEEVTSDVSADALQALLLLIQFGLFFPRKVDVWKLLDFACRLSVELNLHSEPHDEFEDEKSQKRRRALFWGLYCLERTAGQLYGRPSDLTEEIITTEYPETLNDIALADPSTFQFALTSHYYRLTYLRSEIFRELYLPVKAPKLPRVWYEQRLEHILSWRRELQFVEDVLGMGSMTCEMGFDTSVCFLFQPIILRALVATKEPILSVDSSEVVPRESYLASCRVIDFYNKVFRGAENSHYGRYPITLISAQYVHQAALTIMAHCLLAIDGRLPVVSFSQELSGGAEGQIDFHGIYEISGNCLILLSTLAKKWPGMVGMLDIYKNLQDKVLPIMMRSGLA